MCVAVFAAVCVLMSTPELSEAQAAAGEHGTGSEIQLNVPSTDRGSLRETCVCVCVVVIQEEGVCDFRLSLAAFTPAQ